MKKIVPALFLALTLTLLVVSASFAQADTLHLSMTRDWGYGGFNNDIQGTFSMIVTGPDNLSRVEYYIDETKIGEITAPPYRLQFVTDNYDLGNHILYAIGFTSDGQELKSNEIAATFVTPQSAGKFIFPILIILVVAVLASALVPMLTSRGKLVSLPMGTERKYGLGGGAICSKCHRPFALPLLAMNLGFSKLARCPYCGKWGAVRIQSIAKLREAERTELKQAKGEQIATETEEEKLKRQLDNSKFQ
ncbi:MAG: Ig-like domain-containing protein [Chloroflexi bacterium]|nr:Ig-like domain-containing protein [Chloroflexota bacterium]